MNGRDREAPEVDSDATPSAPPTAAAPAPIPALPITRMRLALAVGVIVVLWLIGVFARQVGEAQSAQSRADQLRARNVAMERDIKSLEREIALIKQPAFVAEMARGYLLGTPGEIAFRVDPAASPLPANAPGSQGIVPTAIPRSGSPLDAWLQALFGSGQ
jgi:cell division protein FtsB